MISSTFGFILHYAYICLYLYTDIAVDLLERAMQGKHLYAISISIAYLNVLILQNSNQIMPEKSCNLLRVEFLGFESRAEHFSHFN